MELYNVQTFSPSRKAAMKDFRTRESCTTYCRSNSRDTQLAVPNDPRYARNETNLGIGQAKEVQFPRARHHTKRRRRWVGVKGSTRNRRRYPKCPSARRLRMVREDIGACSEGAKAWMAADEAFGCTCEFLTM
ncbi:uncharacterized protein TNCV_2808081 [Trichonephila clavipes]|nr:uncharacterized protein TNCV_2808081 [Trichonephila clavipes]